MTVGRPITAFVAFLGLIASPQVGDPSSEQTGSTGGTSGGKNLLNVEVFRSAANVPIGTKVTINCEHDATPNPKYLWAVRCLPQGPASTKDDWDKKQIKYCGATPGTRQFAVDVNGSRAFNTVTFHAPDKASFREGAPTMTDGWMHQKHTVTLSWNGVKLGSCAKVCCQETVITKPNPKYPFIPPSRIIPWFPKCSVYDKPNKDGVVEVKGAPKSFPNLVTWRWKSPTLWDRQVLGPNPRHSKAAPARYWERLKRLDVGTELATKTHYYQFHGSKCPEGIWGPRAIARRNFIQAERSAGEIYKIGSVKKWSVVRDAVVAKMAT